MHPGILRACSTTFAALVLALTCAAQDEPTAEEQAEEVKAIAEYDAAVMREFRKEDLQTSGLARAEARFGMEMLQQAVATDPAANHVVAPLGAFTLLNLMAEGASPLLRDGIDTVLHVQALDRPSVRRALATLRQSLTSLVEGAVIDVASAIWLDKGVVASPGFLAVARDDYGATVAELDFSDAATVKAINDWAAASSHGTIPAVVQELQPEVKALAVTVTSFTAQWLHPFDEDGTQPHAFKDESGRSSEVPMMHVYQNFAWQHDASLGAQIVQLPTLAMPEDAESPVFCSLYVILPDAGHSVRSVLDQLAGAPLSWRFSYRLLAASSEMSGDVRLPRFRFTGDLSLVDGLGRMGLKDALKGASLPGIVGGLSDFDMHESTTISVDERGLAMTSTDLAIVFSAAGETSSFSFVADHPFIYVLFDEPTGAVLCAGVMARPE